MTLQDVLWNSKLFIKLYLFRNQASLLTKRNTITKKTNKRKPAAKDLIAEVFDVEAEVVEEPVVTSKKRKNPDIDQTVVQNAQQITLLEPRMNQYANFTNAHILAGVPVTEDGFNELTENELELFLFGAESREKSSENPVLESFSHFIPPTFSQSTPLQLNEVQVPEETEESLVLNGRKRVSTVSSVFVRISY